MAKTANLYARIEPEVKKQAEEILASLGVPAASAIAMFYKQIILQHGIPFDVKLPTHVPDVSKMTEAELDAELEKGYAAAVSGKTISAKEAFDSIRENYNL